MSNLTKKAFADFVDEIASGLENDFAGCAVLWEEMCEVANEADMFPPLQRSIPMAVKLGRKGPEPTWAGILGAYAQGLREGVE